MFPLGAARLCHTEKAHCLANVLDCLFRKQPAAPSWQLLAPQELGVDTEILHLSHFLFQQKQSDWSPGSRQDRLRAREGDGSHQSTGLLQLHLTSVWINNSRGVVVGWVVGWLFFFLLWASCGACLMSCICHPPFIKCPLLKSPTFWDRIKAGCPRHVTVPATKMPGHPMTNPHWVKYKLAGTL